MNPLDNPLYYLNNFHTLLDWIEARYPDLLADDETAFMQKFRQTPEPAQGLLVRMVMRKGTLFRASRLHYAEIGDLREAVPVLIRQGWVDDRPDLDLDTLFSQLTLPEIRQCFGEYLTQPQARKPALLEQLQPLLPEPRTFREWWPENDDHLYALTCMPVCERFRLMFFGNLHQDWSEFVLADLGIYRYETVEFSLASRAFQKREDVDLYLHLHHCREAFESGQPLPEVLAAIPPVIEHNGWLNARRSKLLFYLGQQCERAGELEWARSIYEETVYPEVRARRIRVLERLGRIDEALALASQAASAPETEQELQQVERMLPRLKRCAGLKTRRRRLAEPAKRIELNLPPALSVHGVELAVAHHLKASQAPVHYVENTLINSLFGLLCWDAVFTPLPGAFFHPFQSGPADLLRPDFHRLRAGQFDHCLQLLDSDDYKTRIRAQFHAKAGLQSPFVHWGVLTEELLEQALTCIPAAHLRACFQRLLANIRANRAGLPDLIQFWPEEKRYRMVEVKGPGDRLQDNQRRWLDFCGEQQIPVAVCYVQWQET